MNATELDFERENMKQSMKRIAEALVQRGMNIPGLGLLKGKMGVVIFFYHYARFTGDKSYAEHAMKLMDMIQEQLLVMDPKTGYADGLAGIGAAIEYLVQNHFIEGDTDEILEDFDSHIFKATIFGDHADCSLSTGITGLGRYLLFRIAGNDANDEHVSTLDNKMLLIQITDIVDRKLSCLKETEIDDVFDFLLEMNRINIYPVKIKRMLSHCSFDCSLKKQDDRIRIRREKMERLYQDAYAKYLSEIQQGTRTDKDDGNLSGTGLYLLSQLDKQHETWMKLL